MARRAGDAELAFPRIEEFLAALIGGQRARIVRNGDRERLAARGFGHDGSQRRHHARHRIERLFAILHAAAIDRAFQRLDLTGLGDEARIGLPDALALVVKTIGVVLAVGEWLLPFGMAFVERQFVGRKLHDFLPLLAHLRVDRIRAIAEILLRHLGEFGEEESLQSFAIRFRVDLSSAAFAGAAAEQQSANNIPGERKSVAQAGLDHARFTVKVSVLPRLQIHAASGWPGRWPAEFRICIAINHVDHSV